MRNMFTIALSIVALLTIGSCAESMIEGRSGHIGGRSLASLPSNTPVAIYSHKPKKSYEVVGVVVAKGYPGASVDGLINELKMQARMIGANGIIVTDQSKEYSGSYTDQYGYAPGNYPPQGIPYGYNPYDVLPYQYYPYATKTFHGFGSPNPVSYPMLEGYAILTK